MVSDYVQPPSGCGFFADENYTVRLSDLWIHSGTKQSELDDILLLSVSRSCGELAHDKELSEIPETQRRP